jgi:hypothetical protein
MSVKISLDLSSVSIKLKGCYPGFVKEGDRKTDKPLVDPRHVPTGLRRW